MAYAETLQRIHALNKFGSRPGLDRVKMLLDTMGNPERDLEFVHIAGTNGKGSVSAVVSSSLVSSGYRTGLFISPYITDFCERIQIDGVPVSHEMLDEVAGYVFSLVDKLNTKGIIITEFEFVMCVGFECFKRQKCDIVVLEVGLGGRLDSTNVISAPVCTAITRIGLDHTDILGDTVEKIAAEKCGIIKSGTSVVSSPQPVGARDVLEKVCGDLAVPLRFSEDAELSVVHSGLDGTRFIYQGREHHLRLVGEHQIENVRTALCVLDELRARGFERITADSVSDGVGKAVNPARFERLGTDPDVIIDGAHNPDGMSTFAEAVRKYFADTKGVLIIGMLSDKDSASSLEYIGGMFSSVYTVPINNPRAMTSGKMAEVCAPYFAKVTACDNIGDAFAEAYAEAVESGVHLCVCGSLYLAGEIRPCIIRKLSGEG